LGDVGTLNVAGLRVFNMKVLVSSLRVQPIGVRNGSGSCPNWKFAVSQPAYAQAGIMKIRKVMDIAFPIFGLTKATGHFLQAA
jgi:hypothetical protein